MQGEDWRIRFARQAPGKPSKSCEARRARGRWQPGVFGLRPHSAEAAETSTETISVRAVKHRGVRIAVAPKVHVKGSVTGPCYGIKIKMMRVPARGGLMLLL